MKNIKFRLIIIALVSVIFMGKSMCQSNIVKVSPLKMLTQQRINFGYERAISRKLYLLSEVQLWRVDIKDEGDGGLYFGTSPSPDKTYTNNGTRFLLGFRVYETLTKDKKINDPSYKRRLNLYYGLSGFSGSHNISRTHHAYSYTRESYNWLSHETTYSTKGSSKKHGEVDLISSGFLLDVGFQFVFHKAIIFEFGLKGGRSWTNTGKDGLVIYPENPADGTHVSRIQPAISSYFIEPTLNFGFTF